MVVACSRDSKEIFVESSVHTERTERWPHLCAVYGEGSVFHCIDIFGGSVLATIHECLANIFSFRLKNSTWVVLESLQPCFVVPEFCRCPWRDSDYSWERWPHHLYKRHLPSIEFQIRYYRTHTGMLQVQRESQTAYKYSRMYQGER